MNYCANPFSYQRRVAREVRVGNVGIGGDNPIRVQSMITCDTMDTEASVTQTIELAEAGCEIVRITAPTVKDAANLQHIVRGLRGPLPRARDRDADRDEPRLALRSDHESLRRHPARDGGKRARVRPDCTRSRLSRLHFLDEIEQPQSDDRGLSFAGSAIK